MELKPIKYKKAYEKLIADKITIWMWNNIFKGCFDILKTNTVFNDNSVIREAIEKGLIYFQDNAFYSKTGKFSNKIAKELNVIGATFSKYRNAYLIDKTKLPTELLWAIDTIKAQTALKVAALQGYLNYQLGELTKKEKKLVFDTAVESIMQDLQKRVYENASQAKIELITPKLSDFRTSEIAKNYTNNLDFWIQNWTGDRIIKMRETVGQMAIDGKSLKDIENFISKEFGISERHAKFLARNESAIATTSYLSAKYKEEGFTKFRWVTNLDGRERPEHKKLNGEIFSFDNPPVIYEKTGQKGLPGETYNCRCRLIPIADKTFLENRKKMFKANNSIIGKLKQCLKVITRTT